MYIMKAEHRYIHMNLENDGIQARRNEKNSGGLGVYKKCWSVEIVWNAQIV